MTNLNLESSLETGSKESTEWTNDWTENAHGQRMQQEGRHGNGFVDLQLEQFINDDTLNGFISLVLIKCIHLQMIVCTLVAWTSNLVHIP